MSRVRAMSEAELEANIASDPDADLPEDWAASAKVVIPESKTSVSIRLDGDVLEFFKSRGPGYQTRINAVLRSFVEHQQKRGNAGS